MSEVEECAMHSDPNSVPAGTVSGFAMGWSTLASSRSSLLRYTWYALLASCVCMCAYLVGVQAAMYWNSPSATSIVREYHTSMQFPTVAICNNNPFRLSYLASPSNHTSSSEGAQKWPAPDPKVLNRLRNSSRVFDRLLANAWSMEANKFLRVGGHSPAGMVLKCEFPDGSTCKLSDFKPLYMLDGLCWEINAGPQLRVWGERTAGIADRAQPARGVTGAGPPYALRLLVNIEPYERIEGKAAGHFQYGGLPGARILVYNSSDTPVSTLGGVNILPGMAMDVPFSIQHRQKQPEKGGCVQSTRVACVIRYYLERTESKCECSLRRESPSGQQLPVCNLWQYLHCVVPHVLRPAYAQGFTPTAQNGTLLCPLPCDTVEFSTRQNIRELARNILPSSDTVELNFEEAERLSVAIDERIASGEESLAFEDSAEPILNEKQARRVYRQAARAYEAQSRYQDDLVRYTQWLMGRVEKSVWHLQALQWGPDNTNFSPVNVKLAKQVDCYSQLERQMVAEGRFWAVFNAIKSLKREKLRMEMLQQEPYSLLAEQAGGDVLLAWISMQSTARLLEDILLFNEYSFEHAIPSRLGERWNTMRELIEDYRAGRLSKRAWARRMYQYDMRHFIQEEFYELWYRPLAKEFDEKLITAIENINATGARNEKLALTASILLFGGDTNDSTLGLMAAFINETVECAVGEVQVEVKKLFTVFQQAMEAFQSACRELFVKELGEYLTRFEFGKGFVRENFAQVNVFLDSMAIEHWRQEPTYSIWSLFCDVGGALGLFMGVSLLKIVGVKTFIGDSGGKKQLSEHVNDICGEKEEKEMELEVVVEQEQCGEMDDEE